MSAAYKVNEKTAFSLLVKQLNIDNILFIEILSISQMSQILNTKQISLRNHNS